jgi:hypothetical protein
VGQHGTMAIDWWQDGGLSVGNKQHLHQTHQWVDHSLQSQHRSPLSVLLIFLISLFTYRLARLDSDTATHHVVWRVSSSLSPHSARLTRCSFKFGASTSAPTSQPSSTQPPSVPTFSLTGATPIATPSTSQPFSFGGASSTQPAGGPAPGTSLFGGAGAGAGTQLGQQGQVGQTPGQSATGGFFGGGMFGAQPSQPSTGTPGASTGGLFGGTSMATPATGGLFGGTPGRQGQTPAQPSGLFGQSASTPAPTSLFGQPSQAAPTPGSSLFGAPAQSSTGPGTGLFGAAPQQQQSALQASTAAGPSSGSGLNKTTKFAETPEQVQKTIEQLE